MGRRNWTPNKQACLDAVKANPGVLAGQVAKLTKLPANTVGDILPELRSYWGYLECYEKKGKLLWFLASGVNSTVHKNWKLITKCRPEKIVVQVVEFGTDKLIGDLNYLYTDAKNTFVAIEKSKQLLDAIVKP